MNLKTHKLWLMRLANFLESRLTAFHDSCKSQLPVHADSSESCSQDTRIFDAVMKGKEREIVFKLSSPFLD
jgi:hypothetical protein